MSLSQPPTAAELYQHPTHPGVDHLLVRRHDEGAEVPRADLQAIKDLKGANIAVAPRLREGWEDRRSSPSRFSTSRSGPFRAHSFGVVVAWAPKGHRAAGLAPRARGPAPPGRAAEASRR